jgi:4-alpha-glucanotransferase
MKYSRSAGIILHPTSLPGPDGIGDLGPEAYRWVEFLADSGCSLWQVLPLGQTGYGDSPYQCFSAFAGNPYLISPSLLLDDGLLRLDDLSTRPALNREAVDFPAMMDWKDKLLAIAYKRFQKTKRHQLLDNYRDFLKDQEFWLTDFALFMAIKRTFGGVGWQDWPEEFRFREPRLIEEFVRNNSDAITYQYFLQYFFFRQWSTLKNFANSKGLRIIGDIPIFISADSADAWSHPEMFYFNKKRLPTVVAGVPPDYFSPTGQLWGNPLYRWNVHKRDGYSWWIKRVGANLRQFDLLRLDHFRGFAAYWEIPAGNPTAEIGRWVKGPGDSFLNALQASLGDLPIIAEDLGEITPDVFALRDQFALPGMKIFQFAFASDPEDPFLPHNYPVNCVAYTGTHDNDTVRGWYETAPEKERDLCRRYLGRSGSDISWDMIRSVWSSVAVMALAPIQDFLSLGPDARMNFPGKLGGNWSWRMDSGSLDEALRLRIQEMNFLYARSKPENS